MLSENALRIHRKQIRLQSARKELLGKGGYNSKKLFEELHELSEEIPRCEKAREISQEFIDELGDFLFCLLGDEGLSRRLQERLDFDVHRMEIYEKVDYIRHEIDPDFLRGAKLTSSGWRLPARKLTPDEQDFIWSYSH